MFGLCRVTVSDSLKIRRLEVFLDGESFLKAMEGDAEAAEDTAKARNVLGDVSTLATEKIDKERNKND